MPRSKSAPVNRAQIHDMHACDYASSDYLCINSCGSQVHGGAGDNSPDIVSRPEGRLDYHMLFVTLGYCVADIGGEIYKLSRGDMLFYRPNEPQYYVFENKSKCNSFWIHFSGTGVPDMIAKAGLSNGNVFHLGDISAIETTHIKLIVETQAKQRGYEQFVLSYMQLILALVYRALPVNEQSNEVITDERMAKVLNVIERLYYQNFDIDYYAGICGIGRDRFMHLFKDTVGVPPNRYIIGVRIKNAKRMLSSTGMPVGEIAERCGFTDPLYFSRTFRKYTGVSPSDYRRIFESANARGST